jgi:hypothetical protein
MEEQGELCGEGQEAVIRPRLRWLAVEFHLWLAEQVELPEQVGATLRGFLKEPMRERLCITRQPLCEGCPALSRCGYGMIWEKPPAAWMAGVNEPIAAILPGPLQTARRVFPRGEGLVLRYLLLGEGVEFVPDLVRGVEAACARGLGKGIGRALIKRVVSCGEGAPEEIYERHQGLYGLERVRPQQLEVRAEGEEARDVLLVLETPLHLTAPRSKKLLRRVDPAVLTRRLTGRLHQLAGQLEGVRSAGWHSALHEDALQVEVLGEHLSYVHWERWSGRRRCFVPMEGLVGHVAFGGVSARLLGLWRLLEQVYVGKYTHYGLGCARVAPLR